MQQVVRPAHPVALELEEVATTQSWSFSKSLWASPQLVSLARSTTFMHSVLLERSLSWVQQVCRVEQVPADAEALQAAITARTPTTPMPKNRFTMTKTSVLPAIGAGPTGLT